jgi:hypothetical protein
MPLAASDHVCNTAPRIQSVSRDRKGDKKIVIAQLARQGIKMGVAA